MENIYVVNCCRTAIGKFGGALSKVKPADMGAVVVSEALRRAGVAPENVDEVMMGCILTAGQGQNVARQISLKAGIPLTVPAYTVGMVCGSGMKTVVEAARAIKSGDADIIVAGGVENMSMSPYCVPSAREGARMFDTAMVDTMIKDALWDVFNDYHMGSTAENICDIWGITRGEMDEFAAASQQKTEAALKAGRFKEEIVAVPVKQKKETVLFDTDEFPRAGVTAEGISGLKPCFPTTPDGDISRIQTTFTPSALDPKPQEKGTPRITAATASGINDGAAALVIASERAVKKYGLTPMARLVSYGQGGVDPKIMGTGPVPAVLEALEKAKLTVNDIDLIEANEAFAAQSLAVARELKFPPEKVNVNGGAIALGHPVGASGARIIVTLLHEMRRRENAQKGLATLCVGGGMGVATVFEKC